MLPLSLGCAALAAPLSLALPADPPTAAPTLVEPPAPAGLVAPADEETVLPKTFSLTAEKGSIQFLGQIQGRYFANVRDRDDDEFRGSFEVTRTRLGIKGTIADPSWSYFVWQGWGASGGALLLDTWIQKDLGDGVTVRFGQFKPPGWNEWTISETRQQFVDRSVVDARFSGLYSRGILATSTQDDWRLQASLTDGLRSWNDSSAGEQIAISARAEYKAEGSWGDAASFTSFRGGDDLLVFGLGAHAQTGARDETSTSIYEDGTQFFDVTADVNAKFGGSNVYAGLFLRELDLDMGDSDSEWGFILQGGHFLSDDQEVTARLELGSLGDIDDTGAALTMEDLGILTVGYNKFFLGHALKWTTDLGVAFDEVDAGWGGTGRGFAGDMPGASSQLLFRTQIQLLF